MREGVEVRLRPGDRERLEGVVSDRKSAQHHVWRARIVLMTADGIHGGALLDDARNVSSVKAEAFFSEAKFVPDHVIARLTP